MTGDSLESCPLVSVVLTTFNRAAILPATLDCIVAQSLSNFELIVCDDASPDSTSDVVRSFMTRDQRIKYHRNDRNCGMPGNLNTGIRLAKGKYVANLHDGDLYDPTLLEKWS